MVWWWSKWPKLVATNLNNKHCCVQLKTFIFIIVFQHVFTFEPHVHKFHITAFVSQDYEFNDWLNINCIKILEIQLVLPSTSLDTNMVPLAHYRETYSPSKSWPHKNSTVKFNWKLVSKKYNDLPYPPCGNNWQNSRTAFLISIRVRLWTAITLNPMSFRIAAIVATSLLGVLSPLRSLYVSLPMRSATFSVAEI